MLADDIRARSADALRALSAPEVERVIGVESDDPEAGLFADIVSLPAGSTYTVNDPALGGGQVLLVIAGGIVHDGKTLGVRSSMAVTHDESAVTVTAGSDGAQLMVMQYPKRAEAWT